MRNREREERPGERPAYNSSGQRIGTWYSGKKMDEELNKYWEVYEEDQNMREARRDEVRRLSQSRTIYETSSTPLYSEPARRAPVSGDSNRGIRGKSRKGRQ